MIKLPYKQSSKIINLLTAFTTSIRALGTKAEVICFVLGSGFEGYNQINLRLEISYNNIIVNSTLLAELIFMT